MNINQETVYWVLSTAAQVYAALIAVFGALAVFQLAISSQFRRDVRRRAVDILSDFASRLHKQKKDDLIPPRDPYSVPTDELKEYWEKGFHKDGKMEMKMKMPGKFYSLMDDFNNLDISRAHRSRLLWSTAILTGVFLIFIAGSLYGLFYISYWLSNRSFFVDLTKFALYVTFILSGVHFWIVFRGEPKKRRGE
jgi:hypothetical protein